MVLIFFLTGQLVGVFLVFSLTLLYQADYFIEIARHFIVLEEYANSLVLLLLYIFGSVVLDDHLSALLLGFLNPSSCFLRSSFNL